MKKLRASEQVDPSKMYVYTNSIYEDLLLTVLEYLGECEHHAAGSRLATMRELSSDTVEDMKLWREKRKELILKDFVDYITSS